MYAVAPANPGAHALSLHDALPISLSEVRLRAEQPSRAASLPEVRGAVPAGEGNQARGAHRVLQQSGLRLRSEEHTSELQSLRHLVCRLLLEKKNRRGTCSSTAPSR